MIVYVLQRYCANNREFADIAYIHPVYKPTLNTVLIRANNASITPATFFEYNPDTNTWILIDDYDIIIQAYKNIQTLLDGNLWELKTMILTDQLMVKYGLVGRTSIRHVIIITAINIQTNAYIVTSIQSIDKNIGDIMYLENKPYQRKPLTLQGGLKLYHEHQAYWVDPNITKRFKTNIKYHNFILYNIYPKHKPIHIFDIKDDNTRILSSDSTYNDISLFVGLFHRIQRRHFNTSQINYKNVYNNTLQRWSILPGYYFCDSCYRCFHLKHIFAICKCSQCRCPLLYMNWCYEAYHNNRKFILQSNRKIHIGLTLSQWLLVQTTEKSEGTRLGYVIDILPTITAFRTEKLFRKYNLSKQQ
jgi:hypothetical protein